PGDLRPTRLCARRGADQLRPGSRACVRASGDLRRTRPQGREAGGLAGGAGDPHGNVPQPEERTGAAAGNTRSAARPRRRGDRVTVARMSEAKSGEPAALGVHSAMASPVIVVDQPTPLFDATVAIEVRGFPARQPVTITAIQTYPNMSRWQGRATFMS